MITSYGLGESSLSPTNVSFLCFEPDTGAAYTKYPLSLNSSQNRQKWSSIFAIAVLCVCDPVVFSLVSLWRLESHCFFSRQPSFFVSLSTVTVFILVHLQAQEGHLIHPKTNIQKQTQTHSHTERFDLSIQWTQQESLMSAVGGKGSRETNWWEWADMMLWATEHPC